MSIGERVWQVSASVGLAAIAVGAATLVGSPAQAAKPDPFEGYYGNTMVCVAADRGNDLCHTWINRDGTFLTFDPTGMHKGHWKAGPTRPDGKTPICWFNDSTLMNMPGELMGALGPPRAAAAAGGAPSIGAPSEGAPPGGAPAAPPPGGPGGGAMVCQVKDFRSVCLRYPSADELSDEDKARAKMTIVERFHAGMCYPLPVKKVGDTWYEDDDPLPGENGLDKLFLLKGHR